MKILRGSPALSPLRLAQLQARYCQLGLAVHTITTEYLHFVSTSAPLSAKQQTCLTRLLCNGSPCTGPHPQGELLLVTPKAGIISSWSSKATDIAHNCGLTLIKRLERGIAYFLQTDTLTAQQRQMLTVPLYDPITETVLNTVQQAEFLFSNEHLPEKPMQSIALLAQGGPALEAFNQKFGVSLETAEINYLIMLFTQLGRDPTDVELYMFAQANSEHCRHKIFNADWCIDGIKQKKSLLAMIKNSYQQTPDYVLSAYKDNAAVMQGHLVNRFFPVPDSNVYKYHPQMTHLLMKVETHNHPTGFAPYAGAATGCSGEIRDEGATGRGGMPKAGLIGFSLSNLRIAGFIQPWEADDVGKPDHLASALQIILEAPLGAASFNNEFGRPSLLGYFRTYQQQVSTEDGVLVRGYHKPIMLTGGFGHISEQHYHKRKIPVGAQLIVLGGPCMKIGLGGSTASSMDASQNDANLNSGSVQRDNPEMERRCQEVINRCWQHGAANPILFIHDVGAGGLANAIPELIHDGGCGGCFELQDIPTDESGMSPLEIWCNESQERYVLAVAADQIALFSAICERERAPYAVIGQAIQEQQIVLTDRQTQQRLIDLPIDGLLGNLPKQVRTVSRQRVCIQPLDRSTIEITAAVERVLRLPTVAEKSFLIHIGDRTITGMVARDQMVGPWQIPVSNCAVTTASFDSYEGEVMALGERAPVALLNPAAAARLAVGEAITNLAATSIGPLQKVKLSANWMAAAGQPGEDAALYDAVQAIGEVFCPALGLTIPVGKDSMSMNVTWQQEGLQRQVTAPISLVISAFAPVDDVRRTVTPQLRIDQGDTTLLFIDLSEGHHALGATALAQVYGQLGDQPADVHNPQHLANFFQAIQHLVAQQHMLAYHDRSDGGLLVTLAEMAFAGHCGIAVDLPADMGNDGLALLFNEALGAVIQIRTTDWLIVEQLLARYDLQSCSYLIGSAVPGDQFSIKLAGQVLINDSRHRLRLIWGETSWQLERLRDDPHCADQAWQAKQDPNDPGLSVKLTFDVNQAHFAPTVLRGARPRLAVLREQGVNSQLEMAAAFDRAGFSAIDVHMHDILTGRYTLADCQMLVACGGFSYGDVLGAGQGWAKSILFNPISYEAFSHFFNRNDTLSLGVCNGCQMLATLREMIPGTQWWPRFGRNVSDRFEARLSLVEIVDSRALLLQGMVGSRLPIAVAHGEGHVLLRDEAHRLALRQNRLVALRYIDNYGQITEAYPANPNGSVEGITAVTNEDGRVLIMMPHPERVFRAVTHSWYPDDWREDGPWMQLFRNARQVLG